MAGFEADDDIDERRDDPGESIANFWKNYDPLGPILDLMLILVATGVALSLVVELMRKAGH